jgi:hypothetical protein
MAEEVKCIWCQQTWTSLTAEHCPGGRYSGCCVTFSSTAAGDAHRKGGRCVPEFLLPVLGLWLDPRGIWGFGTAEGFAKRQERAAKMRAAKARTADQGSRTDGNRSGAESV